MEAEHIGTINQLADIFTKARGRARFIELRSTIGVVKVQ